MPLQELRLRRRRRHSRGQALVEFALVIPIFMTLVVAIFEFSFLLTIKNELTMAAADSAQLGAQLGNTNQADFFILQRIENDLASPIDKTKITSVKIFKTNPYGAVLGTNTYTRSGSWTGPDSTVIPWGPVGGGGGYPENSRCSTLLGCGGTSTGVDWLGITITYQYAWITPLPGLVGLGTSGPTMVQTNVTRLEPIQ
jgi:hypothetical protein